MSVLYNENDKKRLKPKNNTAAGASCKAIRARLNSNVASPDAVTQSPVACLWQLRGGQQKHHMQRFSLVNLVTSSAARTLVR